MKQIGKLLFVVGLFFLFSTRAFALTPDELAAESAVLIDADTGQVLFDKNMDARRHPASITKIITGLLAMEYSSPEELATVSEDAVDIPYDTSHVALTPGEELPVDSLMYALMLPSANDAANALAEHVAGSQSEFAKLMTERAAELGAENTNFSNPHGLDEPFHLTTARDMALITREAIRNERFLHYFGTARHTIPATNKQRAERPFTNQQFMLLPDQWVYNKDVIGGKVGFTDEARHTMSTAAQKDGRTLIAVVMGCGVDEKFYDTQALLDYGFHELAAVQLPAEALADLPATAVTRNGETVGEITYAAEPPALWLPPGINTGDIAYDYSIPKSLEEGEQAEASVRVRFTGTPGKGVPELLMELPLSGSVLSSARSGAPQTPEDQTDADAFALHIDWDGILSILKGVVVVAAGGIVLMIAMRKVQLAKRRSRRMRRMERILRMRERA